MAPEQWRGLAEAGPAADVYAFGAMLYELFAGFRPFDPAPAVRRLYRVAVVTGQHRVYRKETFSLRASVAHDLANLICV